MYMIMHYLNLIEKDKHLGFIALSMTDEVETANEYILDVCASKLNPAITSAIKARLDKGKEAYGHELRPLDDTTTWGTKEDSWLEMAEEEIADAIIYILTNWLRLVENGTNNNENFWRTMYVVKILSQLHEMTGEIPSE